MSAPPGELPAGLTAVSRTPVFDESTIPAALRRGHRTAEGVWGVIRVLEGRLLYRMVQPASQQVLDPQHCGVIPPARVHEVEPLGPVRFVIEFYADPPEVNSRQIRPDGWAGT